MKKTLHSIIIIFFIILLLTGCDNYDFLDDLTRENLPDLAIISVDALNTNNVQIKLSAEPDNASAILTENYSIVEEASNNEIQILLAEQNTDNPAKINLVTEDLSGGLTYILTIIELSSSKALFPQEGLTAAFITGNIVDTRAVELYTPDNGSSNFYLYPDDTCVPEAKVCENPMGDECTPSEYQCPDGYDEGDSSLEIYPELTWSERIGAQNYTLDIANDSSFSDIVLTKTTSESSYTISHSDLQDGLSNLEFKYYYWRVKANYATETEDEIEYSSSSILALVSPFAIYVAETIYDTDGIYEFSDDFCGYYDDMGEYTTRCTPVGNKYNPFINITDAILLAQEANAAVADAIDNCTGYGCTCVRDFNIFVAMGVYDEIKPEEGISLRGGYYPGPVTEDVGMGCMPTSDSYDPSAEWDRDIDECATGIQSLSDYSAVLYSPSTWPLISDTVLEGFYINTSDTVATTRGDAPHGIVVLSASPTITNNIIYGEDAILSMGPGAAPVIENNRIFAYNEDTEEGRATGVISFFNSCPSVTDNYINDYEDKDSTLGAFCYGIYSDNSTPHVVDNVIYAGNATTSSIGIYINADESGMTFISGNQVFAGDITMTGTSIGLSLYNLFCTEICNNVITSGDINSDNAGNYSLGIQIDYYYDMILRNNTIVCGNANVSGLTYGIELIRYNDEFSGDEIKIENNIIYNTSSSIVSVGIMEMLIDSDVSTVRNNDIYGFVSLYYDFETVTPYTATLTMETMLNNESVTASGNISVLPVFEDTAQFDYNLSATSNKNIRQGGIDGQDVSESWTFSEDIEGTTRTNLLTGPNEIPTNVDAGGWSMGAYELD